MDSELHEVHIRKVDDEEARGKLEIFRLHGNRWLLIFANHCYEDITSPCNVTCFTESSGHENNNQI